MAQSPKLSPEQVEFVAGLLKSGRTLEQINSALKEHDRGYAYRQDRGKASRLIDKLACSRQLTDEHITMINKLGKVAWFRQTGHKLR